MARQRKRGRPATEDHMTAILLRIPAELFKAIEVEREESFGDGRATVIRTLLKEALATRRRKKGQ
jgi:hypothetical protein